MATADNFSSIDELNTDRIAPPPTNATRPRHVVVLDPSQELEWQLDQLRNVQLGAVDRPVERDAEHCLAVAEDDFSRPDHPLAKPIPAALRISRRRLLHFERDTGVAQKSPLGVEAGEPQCPHPEQIAVLESDKIQGAEPVPPRPQPAFRNALGESTVSAMM